MARYLAACDAPFLGSLLRVAEMIDGSDTAPLDEARHGRQLLAPFCGLAILNGLPPRALAGAGGCTAVSARKPCHVYGFIGNAICAIR